MNELNELCKYARGQTTGVLTVQCNNTGTLKTGTANDLGGFMGDYGYLSSSEFDVDETTLQYLPTGQQYTDGKTAPYNYIRPIRAF